MTSPADGIALSSAGDTLFYSCIDGASLFSLDASIFRSPNVTTEKLRASVKNLTEKNSFSDGLRYLPDGVHGDVILYGSNSNAALFFARRANGTSNFSHAPVLADRSTMQWLDTLAFVPGRGRESGTVYFTTNKLQLYFVRRMDFSGGSGENFRLWRMRWRDV
jgi:hypothetical protein